MDREPLDFNIEEKIAVLGPSGKNWSLELNLVSWGGRPAKYDLRPWAPDYSRMGKGIGLTEAEAIALRDILNARFPA